jgi:hypothetical protein
MASLSRLGTHEFCTNCIKISQKLVCFYRKTRKTEIFIQIQRGPQFIYLPHLEKEVEVLGRGEQWW